jgi:ferric-dicitrate binding protein FerR (iron transport regulator)
VRAPPIGAGGVAMTIDRKDSIELGKLLTLLMDGNINTAQLSKLRNLLAEDPVNRQYYVEFMAVCANLRRYMAGSVEQSTSPSKQLLASANVETPEGSQYRPVHPGEDIDAEKAKLAEPLLLKLDSCSPEDRPRIIREYAEQQLEQFLAQQREREQRNLRPHYQRPFINFKTAAEKLQRFTQVAKRIAIALVICSVLAFGVVLTVTHIRTQQAVIATVVDSVHAQWTPQLQQMDLRRGRIYLTEGFAQINFASGSEVILQAPCEFELSSQNKMYLKRGMITARVPKQAFGFTVVTPASQVVDFGTEFGVMVGTARASEVHVFQGQVQLRCPASRYSAGRTKNLTRGQAAKATNIGEIHLVKVSDGPEIFVREMPDRNKRTGIPGRILDLADIVGGGNGFGSGKIDQGIDPSTGFLIPVPSVGRYGQTTGQYMPLPAFPFIDGVFAPDGGEGQVVTSSTGLVFDQCPDTTGQYWLGIHNGAKMKTGEGETFQGQLDGKVYGTIVRPAINMHANAGITFDLDGIRAAMPAVQLVRFTSLCGISQTTRIAEAKADFWVLVDNVVRAHFGNMTRDLQPAIVNIALKNEDRFLTLITIDDGVNNGWVWSLFAEPIIELEPKNE